MAEYYSWRAISDTWIQQYSRLGERPKAAIQAFFDGNNMFAPGTPGIHFAKGQSVTSGRWEVIVSQATASAFESILKDIMHLVDPSLPVPEMPATGQYDQCETTRIMSKRDLAKLRDKASRANKRIDKMATALSNLDTARRLLHQGRHVIYSIDIEAYEYDHDVMLEIGWSAYDCRRKLFLDQHYIMSEYRHLVNGKFVSDVKENFNFGTSVWCTQKQALEELRKDLAWSVERDGGYVLLGHSLGSDIKFLEKAGFLWPTRTGESCLKAQDCDAVLHQIDTEELYAATIKNLHNPPSLGQTLSNYGIETWHLHNAGNDAHYTMELLWQLAR